MSSGGIVANRSSSTDTYAHCHSIPSPNYASSNEAEVEIVKQLVNNTTLSTASATEQTLSGYEVTKVSSSDTNQILPVCYPPELIEKDAVLSAVYKNNEVVFDSNSVKLSKPSSNNNEVTMSVDNTSTSIYDTTVKVTTSIETNLSSLDESVDVLFDSNDTNAAVQYAVNSQYNTKTDIINMQNANVYPTYVQEDTAFNTNMAFGKNYTQYISSIDSTTGLPIWSNYSNNVSPITDKFQLTVRDEPISDFSIDDVGIFKVSLAVNSEPVKVTLERGSDLNNLNETPLVQNPTVANPIIADEYIKSIPLFHETNTLSESNQTKDINTDLNSDNSKFLLPSNDLTIDQLKSLVDLENEYQIANPNFKFEIAVTTNPNSGYKFADSQYDIATIDDSELKDSLIYMKDWVNYPHTLSFNSGHLSLTTGIAGVQSVIDNNEIVLDGGREKLSLSEAGENGVICINSSSFNGRSDITSELDASNMKINVYYENDTIPSGLTRLSDELCVEPNVSFGWQKVIEKSSESSVYLKENSGTTLNLISTTTNELINNDFSSDSSKFDYTFDSTKLPSNSNIVNLWKIQSGINLVSQPSKFIDVNENLIQNIISSVLLSNATPTFNQSVRELRQFLKVKTNTDLNINSQILSNGWSPSLSRNTILETMSNAAYQPTNRLPNYSEDLIGDFLRINSSSTLDYKIEYSIASIGAQAAALTDKCSISFQYSNSNIQQITGFDGNNNPIYQPFTYETTKFDINETDMLRTTNSSDVTNIADVPLSEYTFVNTYNTTSHKLVKVTKNEYYSSTFNLPFAQYTNYQVRTPNMVATSITYAIQSRSTGSMIDTSTALRRVRRNSDNSTVFYTFAYGSISPVNNTNSLTITGSLSRNDLREMFVSTQSKVNNSWTTISNEVNGTVYYDIENEPVINDVNDELLTGSANVQTNITIPRDITDFSLTSSSYTIPLVMDYKSTVYTLKSFGTTSEIEELNNKTTLVSASTDGSAQLENKVLTIDDMYSVIKSSSWVTPTEYKIVSSINDNDVTIKVVKTDDVNEDAIITIRINDNYIFVGEFLVSHITKDVVRIRKTVGSDYTENFNEYESNIPSFTIEDGVYVNKINTSTVIPLGSYQLFNLKKDMLAYNLVGSSLGSLQQINSLGPYQWTNDSYYSDKFYLTKYRGHGHPLTTSSSYSDQYYNIIRPEINATFKITNTNNSSTLSQTLNNIYSGAVLSLNNLKRTVSDANPSDIGLKLTFNFSMPNNVESREKIINVVGDDVAVRIENPRGPESYNPIPNSNSLNPADYVVPLSLSLKDYALFTLNGANAYRYGSNSGAFRIRSSRVKLVSTNSSNSFEENAMRYKIFWDYDAQEVIMKTYRARIVSPGNKLLNYVGNPELIGLWGSAISELNLDDARNIGVNIGAHTIKLISPNIENFDSYYVSSLPYYKYETMGVGNNITIPYNYDNNDFSGNRVIKYMPNLNSLNDLNGYKNPFTNITYTDMLNNSLSVNKDNVNNLINDMKFRMVNPRNQKDLHYSPSSTKKYIQFYGSRMQIDLYKDNQFLRNVYDDYVTSLTQNLDNNISLVSSNIASGIKFMIRQPINVIGYSQSETDAEHEAFYNTTDKTKWFPFKFTLSNVNMVRPLMTFNMLAGPGTYATLYTVKTLISTNPENIVRRVYKYENATATDFDDASLKLSLSFSERKYVDFIVPSMQSDSGFNSDTFNNLLNQITVGNSLNWVTDANFVDELGSSTATFTLAFGNSAVSNKFRREALYANNNETVFTLISYLPLMVMNNQIGMPLYSVQWNGYSKIPQIITEVSVIAEARDSYLITESNLSTDIAKHSSLKL